MPHFKLTLAYDGTAFVGWQRQSWGISIQGLLEDALAELDGAPVAVAGAGRTDAGVHALGQVASVALTRTFDADTVVRAVNARLPETVRVLAAREVPETFHARFSAKSKTYRYRLWNAEVLDPFERAYVWHIPSPPLDVEAMALAAAMLEGHHDFAAFETAGAETRDSARTVSASRVFRGADPVDPAGGTEANPPTPVITCEITGDGFLRHMVRAIVGTLVEIGRGRHPPPWMRDVLTARSRTNAGRTAPASGLFLVRVEYE